MKIKLKEECGKGLSLYFFGVFWTLMNVSIILFKDLIFVLTFLNLSIMAIIFYLLIPLEDKI